jgi:hypothetical protein
MHASTEQVNMMWYRYERETTTFGDELAIHCIVNRNDENHTRLPLYKENFAGLRVGNWVGNTIINFFAWKTSKRLDKAGVPYIYKQFRTMDASFMFYMYIHHDVYNYNAYRRMVKKNQLTKMDMSGIYFSTTTYSFHSTNTTTSGGSLSFVQPKDKLLLLIPYMIRENGMLPFSTILLGSSMSTKDKKNSPKTNRLGICIRLLLINNSTNDDCGVCLSLAIYCLVHGLDYRTMPPFLFANQARLFIYYIVMGYQFDQDDTYYLSLDEVVGTSTIVDDDTPAVDYRDDANLHERGQPTRRATHPPPLPQLTAADLQYPNDDGEINISDDDNEYPRDGDYTDNLPTNLEDTIDQEHDVTALLGLTGMAITMADQEQEQLEEEDNDGETHDQVNAAEGPENIAELQRQLRNQVADVDQNMRRYQEARDSSTE